jgi:N-glycosylase/DNA lyase
MTKIYNLLKNYTLEDALNLEKQDLQYKSLEKLYNNIQDKHLFF